MESSHVSNDASLTASVELRNLSPDTAAANQVGAQYVRTSLSDGTSSPAFTDTTAQDHTARVTSDIDQSTTLPNVQPSSVWSTFRTAIMSRNLLLMRSSPALGTGSYGAVPVLSNSLSDSDDEEIQEQRTRQRRQSSPARQEHVSEEQYLTHRRTTSTVGHKYRSKRRRSNATDVGMGIDNKASFAVPTEVAGSHSSSASSISEDGDDCPSDHDNSPYPEVRASVPNTDNTTLSINTPRMWFLSMFFAVAGSATNLFFSLRYPSVAITPVIALVLESLW